MAAEPQHVIVGGGVIGLAVAYELLRRGRKILLLERSGPGGEATAAAAGMLAPVSEAGDEPPELIELGCDSLRRFPRFVEELERLTGLGCGYRAEGTLWVALDHDALAQLRHLGETLARRELPADELGADELRGLEPHLSPRALGGLRVSGDHQVDPRALARCLRRAVELLGGKITAGMEVRRVETRNARVIGLSGVDAGGREFRLDAQRIVVAAGAWSERGIELPLESFGLRPVKGQLLRLVGPPVLDHVLRTPEVYLVPRSDGELLLGGTMEEVGFDTVPTAGAAMDLLRCGWEVVPAIYEFELAEISVGLRPALENALPRIGATSVEGLFLAFGHFRNGVLLAPATAHYLAEWLVGGRSPAELRPFAPERRTERSVPGATPG